MVRIVSMETESTEVALSQEVALPRIEASVGLEHLSATICAELAAGLSEPADIRAKYNISDEQWDTLRHSPVFRAMMREAVEKLAGDSNAGRRITMKAEIALEDSIPTIYSMVHSRDVPAASRLDAAKILATLANRTGKMAESNGAGAGFAVNIHIDTGEKKGVIINGESSPPTD